LECL